MPTKKHPRKKWEVGINEFQNHLGKKFKVTRRLPEMFVAETKIFRSKKRAKFPPTLKSVGIPPKIL